MQQAGSLCYRDRILHTSNTLTRSLITQTPKPSNPQTHAVLALFSESPSSVHHEVTLALFNYGPQGASLQLVGDIVKR